MNSVAMNIDTFEERLLQRNSLLGPLLTTDSGAFLEFFYVLHCLPLNILPRVRNRDSGFRNRRKIFYCGIRNPGKFSCKI